MFGGKKICGWWDRATDPKYWWRNAINNAAFQWQICPMPNLIVRGAVQKENWARRVRSLLISKVMIWNIYIARILFCGFDLTGGRRIHVDVYNLVKIVVWELVIGFLNFSTLCTFLFWCYVASLSYSVSIIQLRRQNAFGMGWIIIIFENS